MNAANARDEAKILRAAPAPNANSSAVISVSSGERSGPCQSGVSPCTETNGLMTKTSRAEPAANRK